MKELILLQFRKNRLTYAVMGAALLVSAPLAVLLRPEGMKAAESLGTTMLYWLFAGVPLAALLFACGAGAEAAREKAALTEQPLPVPQYSLLLSGLFTALAATLALAIAAGLGAIAGFSSEGPMALYAFLLPYYAFSLVFLTLYGFTLAYAFANGIAGGALAAAALAAVAGPVLCIDGFQEVTYSLIPLGAVKALLLAASLAGGAYALKLLSERGDRAAYGGRKLASFAALLLAVPAALSFLALVRFNARAAAVIMPVQAYTGFARYNTFPDPDIFGGAAMFQRPLTGEMFLADQSGKKTVMVSGATSREKGFLYLSPYMSPYRDVIAAADGAGKAWVFYGQTAALTRLFHGGMGGFDEYPSMNYGYGLSPSLGKKKGVLNFRADGSYFADLKPGMKELKWRKVGATSAEGARYLMNMESQDVYLTADRRTGVLSYKGLSWKLPSGGAAVPVPLKDGKTAFIVNTGSHKPSYICLPGAKPAEFAPMAATPGMNLYLNPDGSVWTSEIKETRTTSAVSGERINYKSLGERFYVLTSDRKMLREIKLDALLEKCGVPTSRPKVLHAEGGRVWFNLDDRYMALVDESGEAKAKLWKFPTRLDWGKDPFGWSSVTPSDKGLFVAGADGMFFMDWEGRVKRL